MAYGASDLLLDGTMVKVIIRLQSDDYKTQDINDEITLRIDGKEFKPNLVNQDNGNWYLIYFTLVGGADANTLASSAFNTYFVELYAANEELLSSCPSTGITDVNKHQELDYRAYELAIVDGVLKLTISDVTPKTYTVKVVTEGMPEGTQAPKLTNQDADVGESVPVDATLTLTVTPVEGYTISVSVDHGEVKDNQNNTYEITLSANATITVKYEKDATEPDPEKEIIGCNDSNIVYISDTEFDIYFRIKVTGYADANAVKNDVKLMIEGITAEALNADDNIFISTDSVHQLRYRINKSQLTAMESGKSYELTLRYASGTKTYKKPASSINTAQFSVTLGNAQYTVKLEDTAVVLAYEELTVVEKKATAYAGSELLKIGSVVRLTINITLQGFTKAEMQGAKLNVANATLMNDSNLNESNNSVFNFDVTNVDIAEEPYKLVLIIGEVQIDVLSAGLAPNYSQDEGEKNYKISIGSGSPPQQLYLTVSAKESGGGGEEHTGTVKSVSGAKLDRAILEVCFDVEGYTAEDLKEVEFHYINLETQQDNNYGQAPSGIRSENGLYVVRFEGLDRISAIGRYRVEFRFKGENYSPAEGASGGPFEFDQFKHTLLNENGVLILVVESLSSASANDIKKADNEGAALGFKDQWSYYLYFGNVTKKTFADGKLEFAFDGKNDNNNWWGIQLYYVDSSVTSGYYSFSFTIYSKNGGTYRLFSDQSDETERTESFVLTAGETKQFTSKVIPFATNRATVTIYMGAGADTNIVADEITITNLVITPATDDASNKTGERTLTEGNDTVIDGTYQDGQSLAVTVSDNDGHTFTFGINGYKINGKEEYRRDTSLSDPHPLEFSEGSSPELSEGSSINITLDYSGGELLITYQVGEITIYTVTISGLSGELRLDAELA